MKLLFPLKFGTSIVTVVVTIISFRFVYLFIFVTQAYGYHSQAQNAAFAFFSTKEPSVFSPTQIIQRRHTSSVVLSKRKTTFAFSK